MLKFQKSIPSKLLITFLFFPILLNATQDESWGIGLLMLPYDDPIIINLYDEPNGVPNGTLGIEKRHNESYEQVWREEGGISLTIPEAARLEYDYEIDGFIVFNEQDSFIQIMFSDGDRIAWASIAELEKKESKYNSWIEFMSNPDRTLFTSGYGMNVRKKPSVKGERIFTVKGDQFEINPTGKTNGLWAEVIIKEYDSEYCEGEHNLIKEYRGWLKILDNKGFPNLWYYTRGC